MTEQDVETTGESTDENTSTNRRITQIAWIVIGVVVTFFLGFGSGYLKWGQDETAGLKQQKELAELYEQVNPADGYTLPVSYGDLGPQLMEAGVIDYDSFLKVMSAGGDAISNRQIDILRKGSDEQIVITAENAHFLLNFFWAVGLANENSILTEGPMVQYSEGQIDRFASTGGWTLATKPITDLYASVNLIPLTPEQQARVEEAAAVIYRPCCNNHTLFPDCNHGMAMLGLLELMASQDASAGEMFEAAKYVNAYWFPQQTLETAIYLKSNEGTDFAETDARLVVGNKFSSASGTGMVHDSLQANGLLKQTPDQGNGCAN
ncbi:MAG: hypothetical protein HZB19_06850 [Chloroflexi bacterium]|nr:hypothetical protein [Chloroflexota bacterium]